jgi:iron complex transport system permease protein
MAPTDQIPLARLYGRFVRMRVLGLAGFAFVLLASFIADVATGPSVFPVTDIVRGIFDPSSLDRSQEVILWNVRLPYAVMALLVGASLGLAGAEMQTVLNNPLASPFTLGVSASATLGASLAIVFGLDVFGIGATYMVPVMAFVFAAASVLLIQALARAYGASAETVILFGIAIYFSCEALIWLVQYVADADTLQQIVFWTMGSMARVSWEKIGFVALVLAIMLPLSLRQAWTLTTLRGGEDQARSFGIRVERLRMISLLRVSVLAAAAVAFVGTIGFVGLIGPHIARMALGEDHRFYLPGSALAGALILSLASIASKMIVPGLILPIGIVTALIGIPLFLGLVLSRRTR